MLYIAASRRSNAADITRAENVHPTKDYNNVADYKRLHGPIIIASFQFFGFSLEEEEDEEGTEECENCTPSDDCRMRIIIRTDVRSGERACVVIY